MAGVSTAPLSYKPWMAAADSDGWETITRNVVRIAERLAQIHQDTGALIHLDIEPEPDCSLENTAETLEFFERRLLPTGAPLLARALNVSESAAAKSFSSTSASVSTAATSRSSSRTPPLR